MTERLWVRCEIVGHGGHETKDGCPFCREHTQAGRLSALKIPLQCPDHGEYLSCNGCESCSDEQKKGKSH